MKNILMLIRNAVLGFLAAFVPPLLAFLLVGATVPTEIRLAESNPQWIGEFYNLSLVAGSLLGGYITARLGRESAKISLIIFSLTWLAAIIVIWRNPEVSVMFQSLKGLFFVLLAYLGFLLAPTGPSTTSN